MAIIAKYLYQSILDNPLSPQHKKAETEYWTKAPILLKISNLLRYKKTPSSLKYYLKSGRNNWQKKLTSHYESIDMFDCSQLLNSKHK